MIWRRKDRYAEVSECGRYSVCAIGGEHGTKFEGWRTRLHDDGPHLVCHNTTNHEAKRLCDADSREVR